MGKEKGGETAEPKDSPSLCTTPATLRVHVPRQGSFQEGEDFHSDSLQGGDQVPDGVLQPAEVQHGRAEAPEEAEDQESHPLKNLASKPSLKKRDFDHICLNPFGKVTLPQCNFGKTSD